MYRLNEIFSVSLNWQLIVMSVDSLDWLLPGLAEQSNNEAVFLQIQGLSHLLGACISYTPGFRIDVAIPHVPAREHGHYYQGHSLPLTFCRPTGFHDITRC